MRVASPRWTPAEVQQVELLAGNVPGFMLLDAYNEWAARARYPQRTERAICHAVSKLGIGCTAHGDWMTTCYVADVLDIALTSVVRWERAGLIPCVKHGRKRFYRRTDIVEMARTHPERFSGISFHRLYQLLEDHSLATRIAAQYPYRSGHGRPVRAVEPDWRFPSISIAARHFHVVPNGIQFALRTGGTCVGYHWERV